jgi:hypothetical protein
MTTETLDKAYLEYSRITKAKTQKELYHEATLRNALDICKTGSIEEVRAFLEAVCSDLDA